MINGNTMLVETSLRAPTRSAISPKESAIGRTTQIMLLAATKIVARVSSSEDCPHGGDTGERDQEVYPDLGRC